MLRIRYDDSPSITDKDKAKLKELQWMVAEQGNVQMLIWLGKQYLGQTDRPQESDVKPINEVVFDGI